MAFRQLITSLAIAAGITTAAFGDILTEQPYYWYQYDASYNQQCGTATLSTGGNTGCVDIKTASPWGKALTLNNNSKAGPYGNKNWALGSDDWTLHIRAKMPSNLDKGVVISLGSCKTAGAFMLLTRGEDAGVYLANTTSSSTINSLAISKTGLSSDYHDFTMVFTLKTLQVQLYIDGEAVSEGAFTLSQQVTDKNWQLFSAHGGNGAVKNGYGVYIEEMRFWQKAWGASDIALLHTGACLGVLTLNEDTDWSAGAPSDKVNAVIDMNGHSLVISDFSQVYSIKNSASGDSAELTIDVPSDITAHSLSGNLTWKKTGAGTLTLRYYDKAAPVCSEIVEGTLKMTDNLSFANNTTITIGEKGTLDTCGNYDSYYGLVMKNGATLTNTGSGRGNSYIQMNYGITLDSGATVYVAPTAEMSSTVQNYGKYPFVLNGGTIVKQGSGKWSIVNANITGGGKLVVEKGELNVGHKGFACDADTVFELKKDSSAYIWVQGACSVPTILGNGYIASNGNKLTVTQRYSGLLSLGKKGSTNPFTSSAKLTLGTGCVLDLNENTAVYKPQDNFDFGSAVTIDVSKRTLEVGMQLVAWNSSGMPSTAFTLDETTAAKGNNLVVNDRGVFFGAEVARSEWTNAGGDGDITNADNWSCYDGDDNPVAGVAPYGSQLLVGDVQLQADADWTATGAIESYMAKTIDLNGHNLAISAMSGSGLVTNSVEGAETSAKFIVNVPEGETWTNTGIAIRGDIQLVKEGAGTFSGNVQNQAYTGGTIINAGTIKAVQYEKYYCLGKQGSDIRVAPNGVLELNGQYDWGGHTIYLDGGTISNLGGNMTSSGWTGLGDITLTADSTISAKYHTLFNANDSTVVDLGGHTLSFVQVSNPSDDKAMMYVNQTKIQNGTVVIGQKIVFYPMQTYNIGENVTIINNGDFRFTSKDLTTLNFTDASMGWAQSCGKTMSVTGRYTPASEYLLNVKLMNGATLDMTEQTEPWTFKNTKATQTLSYEAGATITVDVSGRELNVGQQIVAWSAKPEGITFKWDDATAAKGVELIANDTGIYYGVYIATAHWTNAAGDGDVTKVANWICTNSLGQATNAIPTDATTVYFAGDDINVQIPNETTWGSVVVNGSLDTNCDWSGLGAVKFVDSQIDLKGHELKVATLDYYGAALSLTDSVGNGVLHLAGGTTKLWAELSIAEGITVYIGGDATLDANGKQGETRFALRFADGATLTNTGAGVGDTTIQFAGGIALEENATATIAPVGMICFVSPSFAKYPIALNGGKLIVDNDSANFTIANANVSGPGVICAMGAKQFNVGYKGMSFADDVVLEVENPGWLWASGAATIPALAGNGQVNCKSYVYTVTKRIDGSLDIATIDAGLKLDDGVTLDLSDNTGVYALPSKVSFLEGTATVDVHGRMFEIGDQIVSWETQPQNVTFVWDDDTATNDVPISVTAVGIYYGYDPNSKEVDKGYWTGEAGDGDPANPANWACTNLAGRVVADAIPTNAISTVVMNVPLSGDLDWTKFGEFSFAADSIGDLNGHRFTIAGFANKTTGVVITNSNEEVTSDFIINVAKDAETENGTTAILGNIRLVKIGVGTFSGNVPNQTYTGGTIISNGTIKAVQYEKYYCLGKQGSDIRVAPNGVLELNGQYDWGGHTIYLAGGTISNVGGGMTQSSWTGLGNITLTADSTISAKYHTLFNASDSTVVDLGGHTLSFVQVSNPSDDKAMMYFNRTKIRNGTVVAGQKIVLYPMQTYNFDDTASIVNNGDFRLNSYAKDQTMLNFTDASMGWVQDCGKTMSVAGRYKPASDYLISVKILDGATIDLSGQSSTWTFSNKTTSDQTMTFAENATISVDLGSRVVAKDTKVIAWTAKPQGVKFVPLGTQLKCYDRLNARDDGLYLVRAGFVFTVR